MSQKYYAIRMNVQCSQRCLDLGAAIRDFVSVNMVDKITLPEGESCLSQQVYEQSNRFQIHRP